MKPIELKREINNSTITVEDFSTSLRITDETIRKLIIFRKCR